MMTTPQLSVLWKPNFRMNRETFETLCDYLRNDLVRHETRMRRPVPVEKRIALGLWRLSTGNSYRSCGLQFGLGKSTAKTICQEFEEALCRRKDLFIRFPFDADEVRKATSDFEDQYHFPQVVGAIDGCHIEINAPPENREDYYNRKQFYSINLQGIVDPNLMFQHIAVGYPGSIHDARVLRLSGIYALAQDERILSVPTKIVSGIELRPMLVGDSAYPLSGWLLKPFPHRGNLTRQQRRFNVKLSAMRSVVERAFGMLKGRWRILLKKVEQKHRSVARTVTAACILHNFCIMQGDTFDDDDRAAQNDQGNDIDDEAPNGRMARQAMLDYLVTRGVI